MSVHKNFIEWYWRDWNKLCTEKLLLYQRDILKLFGDKFYTDAGKDGERWRILLKSRWEECGELCNEIHLVLWWNDVINEDLRSLINNIVNLDYSSLLELFQTLKNNYTKNWGNICIYLDKICVYLDKMRKISKPHTTIIEK